jgi:hypothetical protein
VDSPLAAYAHQIAAGLGGSSGSDLPAGVNAAARQVVATAARAGFVDGLNLILLVGAVVAFLSAVASLTLIRGRDFVTDGIIDQHGDGHAPASPAGAEPARSEQPTRVRYPRPTGSTNWPRKG